jgi:hypothetical protein
MNIMHRPPPCPPSDWSQLIDCWKDAQDFKKLIQAVIEDIYGGELATKAYVDQAVQQSATEITTGVTDGSIAGPGMVGETVFGIFPATPGELSDTHTVGDTIADEFVMTLPAGAWQMSFQAVLVVQSGSLTNIGFGGFLGDGNFGNILIGGNWTGSGLTDLQIPALIWSGSTAIDMPVSIRVSNVQGAAGSTFKYAVYAVAFRYR